MSPSSRTTSVQGSSSSSVCLLEDQISNPECAPPNYNKDIDMRVIEIGSGDEAGHLLKKLDVSSPFSTINCTDSTA